MKIEEIRISAPWGHIAAKTWNDERNEAVIVTHGYQDNAGSFDRLIPLLPESFYYICVDLPGHGFSSYFHDSVPVHYVNFLLAYKIVASHFKRKKYVLLGHSFGGQLSLLFAQLYPKIVSKVIAIDSLYIFDIDPKNFSPMIVNAHEVYFEYLEQKSKERPAYTYEEIVAKVKDNRYNGTLTLQTAEDLAKRMIAPTHDGKYTFTVDPRLKGMILPSMTVDYNIEFFKLRPVTCPVLMLLMGDQEGVNKNLLAYFENVGFRVEHINDHHHAHHTDPEVVQTLISDFLLNKHSKL